ncbi:Protein ALTERED PHOSPHATE STARVATION RESPONSE 1 [Linum perenne]
MGCSTSKLDDEEAVQLCKDRKRFIKQAVEQRTRFASGHLAYVQSLKRVSSALREYIEWGEPQDLFLDSFMTPNFTPIKKGNPQLISSSHKSFSPALPHSRSKSTVRVNYLKSGGNQTVLVEERPQSPETHHLEAYPPMQYYGADGFFGAQQASQTSSSFFSYSPNDRPYIPPSPQTSQWDGFWDPFSSLDYYGYNVRSSIDHQMVGDDEVRGLRRVREEEGIPDLEDETEHEVDDRENVRRREEQAPPVNNQYQKEEVLVEDVDEDEDDDDDDDDDNDDDDDDDDDDEEICFEGECKDDIKGSQPQCSAKVELSQSQNIRQVKTHNRTAAVAGSKVHEAEKPGFTVYVNKRPTSMAEVVKDLEDQFTRICDSAKEVSALLESSKAQYSSTSNDLAALKMLNPVALIRSASFRSSSARFVGSFSRDEGDESCSDLSEESCAISGGHQSTLDRLYAWEKKLFEEVKSGEKVRIAYEKKCMQLRNQDVKGEDPTVFDKTRTAIRDLQTQMKVSIHSVEVISKRIQTLRDEELQPQLLELVQGLATMWKVMAECHQLQKQTLDRAKVLLAGTPSKLEARRRASMSMTDPQRLARSAANVESELRNWRACFETWITSQRSYIQALTGWLLRCVRLDPEISKLPFSPPRRSSTTFPLFGLCIQWSRFLDDIQEKPVLDGLETAADWMGSIHTQQLRDDSPSVGGSRRYGGGGGSGEMDIVEVGKVEEVMTVEKMAEIAMRVLCAGMSVTISSLTEFGIGAAEGYAQIFKQWENIKSPQPSPPPPAAAGRLPQK